MLKIHSKSVHNKEYLKVEKKINAKEGFQSKVFLKKYNSNDSNEENFDDSDDSYEKFQ